MQPLYSLTFGRSKMKGAQLYETYFSTNVMYHPIKTFPSVCEALGQIPHKNLENPYIQRGSGFNN